MPSNIGHITIRVGGEQKKLKQFRDGERAEIKLIMRRIWGGGMSLLNGSRSSSGTVFFAPANEYFNIQQSA